ncbi:Thioredoxin-like domain-containing protein [Spironucleus salmonicida]|uniref:Thioredoxin-like domain-containing protein n=1 Tax=Spironucleus salmonicida TaxID=348837 RepID=V6LCH4_9EUKA|nr:Thioredoxin-like domain-containing protein [Spironucleus salmonicida]|eukprot:EST41376.1 Thioredoxin-like domain-containing protein [Spironucleus salmonicida]
MLPLLNQIIQFTPDTLQDKDNYLLAYIYPTTPFIMNELLALQQVANFTVATINCQIFTDFCANITDYPTIQYTSNNYSYIHAGIKSKNQMLQFVQQKNQPIITNRCNKFDPCFTIFYSAETDLNQYNFARGNYNFQFQESDSEFVKVTHQDHTKSFYSIGNVKDLFSQFKNGIFPELRMDNFQQIMSNNRNITILALDENSNFTDEFLQNYQESLPICYINASQWKGFLGNFDLQDYPGVVVILNLDSQVQVFRKGGIKSSSEALQFVQNVQSGLEIAIEIKIRGKYGLMEVFVFGMFFLIVAFSVWFVCCRKPEIDDDEEDEQTQVSQPKQTDVGKKKD